MDSLPSMEYAWPLMAYAPVSIGLVRGLHVCGFSAITGNCCRIGPKGA